MRSDLAKFRLLSAACGQLVAPVCVCVYVCVCVRLLVVLQRNMDSVLRTQQIPRTEMLFKKEGTPERGRPFPPHRCRGMRPENYLVVQVEEKRSPFEEEELVLKTDTSFTTMQISFILNPQASDAQRNEQSAF
ncbi:hypothetical protein F2P81_013514 [Scophthalmus maximus]|uniref:Uncharacterized protein n=1 Tax=Scophthalmus maximus TaxID=52904 RepID=A0A6A4SMP4_SCOMX|nr:hypothetical protein F2P81_013514 [Scophthalmus maximus]